jgi:peroxiredoxin
MSSPTETQAPQPPKLKPQGTTPLFYLPSTAGGRSGPASLRSKYNMVLAFVDATAEGEAYSQSLAGVYQDVLYAEARVIAVVPLPLPDASALSSRLKLPFALLADEGGETTRRMLGSENASALCVADRFGQVHYLALAHTAAALPPIKAALDWLDFIQVQCPE